MHKHLIVVAGVLVLTTASGPAWAGWGCAARASNGKLGSTWANKTEDEARANALKFCAAAGSHCRVIGCSSDIDNEAQADAKWPTGKTLKYYGNCGRYGGQAC
jgi:hypothetical protein